MNVEKKRYLVEIFNEQYALVSDEPEEAVYAAAQMVNLIMHEISQAGIVDHRTIAVLAALRVTSQMAQSQMALDKIEQGHQSLIHTIDQHLQGSGT